MTAIVLQFPPRVHSRSQTRATPPHRPCEVVSLAAWRRRARPCLASTDVLISPIRTQTNIFEGSLI